MSESLAVGQPTPGFGPSIEDIRAALAAYQRPASGPQLPSWAGGPSQQPQPAAAPPAPAQTAPQATQGLDAMSALGIDPRDVQRPAAPSQASSGRVDPAKALGFDPGDVVPTKGNSDTAILTRCRLLVSRRLEWWRGERLLPRQHCWTY